MTLSSIIARRMADEEEFSIEITKLSDSLAERGFNRLLRDEQKSSLRQLLRGGDLPFGASNWLWKEPDFPGTRDGEGTCLCFGYLSTEKYCRRSNIRGLFKGIICRFAALQAIESGKFKLLFILHRR